MYKNSNKYVRLQGDKVTLRVKVSRNYDSYWNFVGLYLKIIFLMLGMECTFVKDYCT